jgi:8-oxo-dGTP diphosphatase
VTPPAVVVAAALLDGRRLLAAQRSEPAHLAGGWELPGGKVEPGETDDQALLREIREELGVVIRIGQRVGGDWPLKPGAVLRVWIATIVSGEPAPLEDHAELRWLQPGYWDDVAWLPADVPVIARIRQLLDA